MLARRLTKKEASELFGIEKEFGLWQNDEVAFTRLPTIQEILDQVREDAILLGREQAKHEIRRVLGL